MDFSSFKNTLNDAQVPKDLPILVQALWHDAKGDWEAAHNIAQTKEGTLSYDQLHAYLHRKEGDRFNANYWYRRCGENMPKISLDEEWEVLVRRFL
ncbi:hypothetical protein Emtol_0410 [Emticicia oligotrophica DSM 17448]|uniref:Uncharacterized protein n=1 Tax=Emticicia oligotrophica (strain DSM 17448 / CIP 109782 / MTCC 6937 / GPTSA100-15) TaxID=929562 RepID=A0ABM5MX20_EMTOG|nr:hypothetical protein [Emticicia oligotrophica]AFK01564.1 hypothetical protein Emtol_0410 [Emticicia oligotrophica DSM 17448]